uniref:GDNF family receptor alpha 4 n=1 Tax=Rhinopithecus roxellana TaxID=61622 RepID=A0A2K6RH14_RHIRO
MVCCLGLVLLLLLLGSVSSAGGNRCVDAAEACTADAQCQRLRSEYVAQCLSRAAQGGCPRARCRRALRRFFARGPPALTHALLFCPCAGSACAERRRQTFVPGSAASLRLTALPAPDGCLRDQRAHCLRAYAGLVGTRGWDLGVGGALQGISPPGWADDLALGVPAGTAVTPNYVDNVSARVAPWCDCGASGNRREDCEAFRGLFTRNSCLDGAIQAFARGWPPVLLDQLNPQGDPEHSLLQVSSAVRALEGRSLLSTLPVLALQALL